MFYVRNARGREPYSVEFLVQSRLDQTRRTKIWEQDLYREANLIKWKSVFSKRDFMVWFSCAQVKVQDLKKSFNGVEKKLMSVEKTHERRY